MKKISKEEFDKIPLHGRGSTSAVYNQILALKPDDEGLVILKTEWKRKYIPTRIVNKIERKYGFKYKSGPLPDRSGWGVIRIK